MAVRESEVETKSAVRPPKAKAPKPKPILTPKYIAEQLADELGGGVHKEKDGYVCRCPVHDDGAPSLLIGEGDTQDIIVTCRAGCKGRDLIQVLKAKNLWPDYSKQRRRLKDNAPVNRKKKREFVGEYDYFTSNGRYSFTKLKFIDESGKKDYRIGVKDSTVPNGFKRGMPKSVTPPLYRLPDLISADAERVVFIVEGEKDADSLNALGCIAVCNHDGAGHWHDHHTKWFEDRNVVILPDNDRAGRAHAAMVYDALKDTAHTVGVLELPDLPEKGDVSDWIAAGGTKDDLIELVEDLYEAIEAATEAGEDLHASALIPWSDKMIRSVKDHSIRNLESNFRTIFLEHPDWAGRFRYNAFTQRVELDGVPTDDAIDGEILCAVQKIEHSNAGGGLGIGASKDRVGGGIVAAARTRTFDPLMDYVNHLEWDGQPRLATWLQDYMNATGPEAYLTKVGTRWLISGIARALDPGCKADQWLILEGAQGAGKSRSLAALVPDTDWFQDQVPDISRSGKDAKIALFGRWIIEIAELEAIRKADRESIKKFASIQKDSERLPYERHNTDIPRRCIFAGTHNPDGEGYFADATGNRRFLPVVVGDRIDVDSIARDRDQLWAEAKVLYEQGEVWWLEADDVEAVIEQRKRLIRAPVADEIEHYIHCEPYRRRDDTTGEITIEWTERPEPLTKVCTKLFYTSVVDDDYAKAPRSVQYAIRDTFLGMGWMAGTFADKDQAEAMGLPRNRTLRGYLLPENGDEGAHSGSGGG